MVLKFKNNKIVIKSRSRNGYVYKTQNKDIQKTDNIESAIKKNNENIYTIVDKFISRFIL